MCVIAAKPKGVDMPSYETLNSMWIANPDGAGLMYVHEGHVIIDKGYMTFDDFIKHLTQLDKKINLKNTAVVLHFRIGTHGGNVPANTHPFPISDNVSVLQKLHSKANIGVAHNGIIHIEPRQKDISDTMEYIASQLAPLYRYDKKFYKKKDLMQLVENAIRSKMAFLTADGVIYTIGAFTEENGILYSNMSYKYFGTWRTSTYRSWPVDYDLDERDGDYLMVDVCELPYGSYLVDNSTGSFLDAGQYGIYMDWTEGFYVYRYTMDDLVPLLNEDLSAFNADGSDFKYSEKAAYTMQIDLSDGVYMDEIDRINGWDDDDSDDDSKGGDQNG